MEGHQPQMVQGAGEGGHPVYSQRHSLIGVRPEPIYICRLAGHRIGGGISKQHPSGPGITELVMDILRYVDKLLHLADPLNSGYPVLCRRDFRGF